MKTRNFEAFGLLFNWYTCDAGEAIPRHNHAEDHLALVTAGRVRVTTDEKTFEIGATDKPIMFRAPKFHAIEALGGGASFVNIFKK